MIFGHMHHIYDSLRLFCLRKAIHEFSLHEYNYKITHGIDIKIRGSHLRFMSVAKVIMYKLTSEIKSLNSILSF